METAVTNRASSIRIPVLAPASAHRKLADALVDVGFPSRAADALSRIVVNPSEMRRRLASPTVERTTGARIFTVATEVWSPLLVVHPDNKRETASRPLPIGGGELVYRPLPELTSDGSRPVLRLAAQSREQLSVALKGAESYLKSVNKLDDEIQDEGVLRPVTVVAIDATFESGEESVTFASTADGSSRTAAAHRIAGVTAAQALFQFSADDRSFRRLIATLAARAADGEDSEELRRISNILVVPAEIIVRVEGTRGVADAAQAVRSLVGLLHVQPPTPWSPGAQLDAQGDEVAAHLRTTGVLTDDEYRYLLGLLRFDEAAAIRLPGVADERAAWILKLLATHQSLVKDAIRRVNNMSRVHGTRIAVVATELAIRSFRGDADHSNPPEAHRSRVGLQLAYQMSEIWEQPWERSGRSADDLRDAALAEVGRKGLGPSQIELAVLGGFELARVKVLVQYSMRKNVPVTNLASPAAILRTMAGSRRGVRLLAEAVRDGRRGESSFFRVDEHGNIEREGGAPATLDADWLREQFDPAAQRPSLPIETAITPEEAYVQRQEHIASTIDILDGHFANLREVKNGAGVPLVQIRGWRSDEARPLTRKLGRFMEELGRYEFAYQIANNIDPLAEDLLSETPRADDENWQ